MASIHQKMLVITSICLCLLVAFGNGATNSTSTATSNTTSTNTTSTNTTSSNTTSSNTTSSNTTSSNTTSSNTTSSNTTSTNATSSNTTSTNSTGTGTSNTTSTAAANTTSSNTTSSNTTSSNVTASNTTSTNINATSNTTSTASSNTTSTAASNTTASNTTASNTTASNKTASNTTASNTTASNTTSTNTTSTNSTGSSTNTSAASSNSTSTSSNNVTVTSSTTNSTSNTSTTNGTSSTTGSGTSPGTNSSSTSTGTSNSTSTNSSSTGNTTGTSNGTAVSNTSAPITTVTKTATVKVKVDQTSIQGTALVIGVIKENLPAVSAYLDTTKTEFRNFVNAAPKLSDKLKTSAVGDKIIGNLTFENVVAIDTQTVRAEYMTEISSVNTSDPIFYTMNGLDQKTIFGTTNTDLKYKVDFVPLTVKNRWHDGKIRIPSESYRPSLRDPDSDDFKKFKTTFETLLREQLLRSVPVVRQVVIKEVLQGSIIVPFAVETNENSTNTTTQSLGSALNTVTSIGDYTVDPNEDSKSMTGSVYISGLQKLDPIPKDQLPVLAIPSRDGEDITTGTVSLQDKNKAPVRKDNYFLTVTIPSFAAILVGIIIFLCCTATATRMMNNNNAKNVP